MSGWRLMKHEWISFKEFFGDNTDDLQRLLRSTFVEPYPRKITISIVGVFRGRGISLHFSAYWLKGCLVP